ncbi:MAG: ATP-binding domain-containing protein, partial [Gemmataceae bacterium]|nr:ATP-binding domain-containing protein [Gemmataceae bacterium]
HIEAHARARDLSLLEAAGQAEFIPGLTGRAAQAVVKFARLIEKLTPLASGQPDQALIKVLDETGYKAALKKTDDADEDHLANIEELITAARQFAQLDPAHDVAAFLENISLASDLDGFNTSQESVTIMTMHAAKGLEFPVVFMVAMEQGLLPHERSLDNELELEEERRLCFVGMTRAMQELQLSHARLREFRGRTTYTIPSSFLDELPHDVRRIERGMRRSDPDYSVDHPMDYDDIPPVMAPPKPAPARSAGPAAPFTPRAGEPDELRQGMFVSHGEYGVGQIVEASGNGALRKVRIRFQTAGLRVFLASKAKLTIVHPGEDF